MCAFLEIGVRTSSTTTMVCVSLGQTLWGQYFFHRRDVGGFVDSRNYDRREAAAADADAAPAAAAAPPRRANGAAATRGARATPP